jgi:hypothetical protein
MITKLNNIAAELNALTAEVLCNKELPPQDQAINTVTAVHGVRTAIGNLDTALHARHNERHPIKASPYSEPRITSSTDRAVLTPEDRADIDATP